jgi:hypothetical protein
MQNNNCAFYLDKIEQGMLFLYGLLAIYGIFRTLQLKRINALTFFGIHISIVFLVVGVSYSLLNHYYWLWKAILDRFSIESTNFLAIFNYINCFGILATYFTLLLYKTFWKNIIIGVSVLFLAVTLYNYFYATNIDMYLGLNRVLMAVYIITCSMLSLWYLYQSVTLVPLNKNAHFWIALGFLLPHVISFFADLISEQAFYREEDLFCKIEMARNFFDVIGILLFGVAFYFSRYTRYLR